MTEDIWGEKPDAELEDLSLGISGYEATEMDDWLDKLKVEHDLLKEHSGRWLHFIALDYTELRESFSPQKLMELKEKAEKFDYWQSQDPTSVQWLIEHRALKDKLEAVKKLKREGLNNWNVKGDYYWLKISEILEASG